MNPEALFDDPDFLSKLNHLDLVAKQILSGTRQGARRSGRRGAGTLFKDYRSYSPGDDLRYLDWNVYGRLGTLFVKEFEVEEAARIRVFLDRSRSMEFGEPTKLRFAKQIAAALGYIGLSQFDGVEIVPLPGGEGRPFAGKSQAPALFDFLLGLDWAGEARLRDSIRRSLAGSRGRGLSILVSDLYDPEGFRPAVDQLLRRRHTVFLLQIVALEEAEPPEQGSLRLIDSETGRRLPVRLDEKLARGYRRAFREFCAGVEKYAIGSEIGYARFRSDLPFGEAVLKLLMQKRIVR